MNSTPAVVARIADGLVLNLHLRAIKRHPRRKYELLSFRFTARCCSAPQLIAVLIFRLITRCRILRDALYRSVKKTVSRESERIDFDFGILSRIDESDIAVRDHGLDLNAAIQIVQKDKSASF
jgi:hypothetical protein